jgi:hypothetical protein
VEFEQRTIVGMGTVYDTNLHLNDWRYQISFVPKAYRYFRLEVRMATRGTYWGNISAKNAFMAAHDL